MFFVDTNVILYAAHADSPEHARCRVLFEHWRRDTTPWYTSWPVIFEFLRVSTHAHVFPKPWSAESAWKFVRAFMTAPALRILTATERHADVTEEIIAKFPALSGNIMHDAHTAALMREHGIKRIVTRDADFYRFKFLEVIDPLEKN